MRILRWGRVEVSGGFLLLATLLWYLDEDGTLLLAGAACVLHEAAHCAAIWGLGGRISRLRLSVTGAELTLSGARPLGHTAQFLAAVSGPVANLAAALLAARLAERGGGEALWVFAGLNLGLAGFNLLPMSQLDGGRALRSLAGIFLPETAADALAAALSWAACAAILVLGGLLFWQNRANFTMLLTALWLAYANSRSLGGVSMANRRRSRVGRKR